MKKILFGCTLFFIISACGTNKNSFFSTAVRKIKIAEFKEIGEFTAPVLADSFRNYLSFSNNKLQIEGAKYEKSEFLIYDVGRRSKTLIKYKTQLRGFPESTYINPDSILMMYSMRNTAQYQDSLFFLGNSKGEIIKYYTLNGTQVYNMQNPEFENSDKGVYYWTNWGNASYKNNKIFLHFISAAQVLGDPAYAGLPIAGYIDMKQDKYYPIAINYPDIVFGKQYYSAGSKEYFSTFAADGDFLCGFKYTPQMIKYDIANKTGEIKIIQSSVFDSISTATSPSDVPEGFDFDMPYPQYYKIQYDKFRNLYYRYVRYPKKFGNGKSVYSIIVADSAFNVIAEGFMPNFGVATFYITKDALYCFTKKNEDGNSIYTGFKMTIRDGTNQELIASLKLHATKTLKETEKPLAHYAKKYGNVKAQNYTAVFMSISGTCHGTTDVILNNFKVNIKKYEKYNVYLFVHSLTPEATAVELESSYGLSSVKYKNIIINDGFRYHSYKNSRRTSLPQIIKVRKRKVVTDTIFYIEDDQYANFQNFLISSGKEQKALMEK